MAQIKVLKIANDVPTEHDGTADDLTVLSLSTDTVNERTGAAGVTIDGVVLKDSGATFGANVVMGDFSVTGVDTITFTDVNGTIAGIENQNLLDKSAAETISGAYTHTALWTGGIADAGTTTSVNPVAINHTSSGTPAAGFGVNLAFDMESASTATENAGSIDCIWTDAGNGTEDADFVFKVMTGGSPKAEVARITSAGDITATSHGGIAEGNLVDKSATEVISGSWDFGGAADFEIPNSATPTVDTAGQIAIDTTITDHTGLITYHDGTEALYAIAIPTGNLSANDGYVISYNATNNEFEMASASAGSNTESYTNGNGGSLAKGDVVYMTTTNDTVDIADADTISHGTTIVGLANEVITTTSSGAIFVAKGKVITGVLTAATAGDIYYLSTTGTSTNTLTTTAPSGGPAVVKIGFAKNATDLVYDPEFIVDSTA